MLIGRPVSITGCRAVSRRSIKGWIDLSKKSEGLGPSGVIEAAGTGIGVEVVGIDIEVERVGSVIGVERASFTPILISTRKKRTMVM